MSELDFEAEIAAFQSTLEQPKPRRGRQPGSKNGSSSKTKITDLREGFTTLVTAANNVFASGTKYARYALTSEETKALAEALAAEFAINPRLQKMVSGFGKVSPHLALIQCVAGISLTRWAIYQQEKAAQAMQPSFRFEQPTTPEPVSTEIPSDIPPQERIRAVRV